MLTNLAFLILIHLFAWVWVRRLRHFDAFLMMRGAGVAAVALLSLPLAVGGMRAVLICVLALMWAARSISHQLQRERWLGPDRGLQEWAARLGPRADWRLLTRLVLGQATILWACSIPIQRGVITGIAFPASALDRVGLVLVVAGMGFEALADHQLLVFQRADEADNQVLSTGLWRWSRHPNHFGTFVVSVGFYSLAAAGGDGFWSLLGPLVTLPICTRLLGGAASETRRIHRRPGYRAYQYATSKFVPWPPLDPADAPMPAQALRYFPTEVTPDTVAETDETGGASRERA